MRIGDGSYPNFKPGVVVIQARETWHVSLIGILHIAILYVVGSMKAMLGCEVSTSNSQCAKCRQDTNMAGRQGPLNYIVQRRSTRQRAKWWRLYSWFSKAVVEC
jgi:hypothetical protein